MLVVRAVEDQPDRGIKEGDEFRLYIVDAHHHMGHEKGHKNTPAGAYDFYAQLWFEIQKKTQTLLDADGLLFEPVRVEAPGLATRLFQNKVNWARLDHGWLVDRTIVFPYTDDYSVPSSKGEPSFKVSNDKIASWTSRAPHSSRLIGFARVNPLDGSHEGNPIAVSELDRAVLTLGLRGLKLHPLAQLFVDSIEKNEPREVVKRAGELGIPVIFDTRNMRTVVRIKRLVDSMRNDPDCGAAMKGLRVILAHCGMSPGDSRLYEALKDPVIFAETSTLHDKDVPVLFESARERLSSSNREWSEKILFGTDFSFLSVQAMDIILHLLSRDFPGTLADTQRVLAGNTLSLLHSPFRTSIGTSGPPAEFICKDESFAIQREIEDSVINLIAKGSSDLSSLDFMIPPIGTWPEPEPLANGGSNGVGMDSYVLTLKSKEKSREFHLWIRRRPGDYVSCTVLATQGMIRLETLENASQKISQVLIRSISDHSQTLQSSKEIKSSVIDLLT
ncbi:MAG: amidohydrolase family protein [Candidatus Thorarchaeota archaeon]|nr:amidohydrolase family protein [Candidatus Thorarchaeota archaeon]